MMIKNIALAGLLCTYAMGVCPARADEGEPRWHVDAQVSLFQLDPRLPRDLIMHSTHVEDQLFMTGSPGTTDLNKVDITFLDLSVGYLWPIKSQVSYGWDWGVSYVLKIPFSHEGREEIQNANDVRPPTEGSFIYTTITNVEMQHEAGACLTYWWATGGLHYAITPSVYFGYWQMSFEKGWDRFGLDQAEQSSDASGISISPQIEVSIGTSNLKLSLSAAYRAINLEYDTAVLGSSVAQGFEVGGSVGWKF